MTPIAPHRPVPKIEGARRSDLAGIQWLLHLEALPGSDLTEDALAHFLVCRDPIGVVGAVGLEPYGEVVLLRSLVVSSEMQGCGIGHDLVAAAAELAKELGAHMVYLLTTNAARFFESAGFRRVDRVRAPTAIQNTTQFAALCPATAILMVKP
jgi:N-acetylglutamate synthase-like GNAT family acetyltransferase